MNLLYEKCMGKNLDLMQTFILLENLGKKSSNSCNFLILTLN